jgi:hypothetical protein
MNRDVVSVKQYSLPLLGNQRKEMNIIRSHHNPPKSITNNVEREGGLICEDADKMEIREKKKYGIG